MTTPASLSRREFLARSGNGCGLLALACLLGDAGSLRAEPAGPRNPLAPRPSHFPAKATAVIWLHMHGAPSSIDLFDPKPELARRAGTSMNLGSNVGFFESSGTVLRSPFRFARHGQCGHWFSEVLPTVARHADDLAFLKGMHVLSNNHGPALYEINTGLTRVGFPSVGSWVTYGLGSENQNLPGFVIMPDPRGSIEGGPYSWGSGFLPGTYQGTPIRTGPNPILHVRRLPGVSAERQRAQLDLVAALNREHAQRLPGEAELQARIESFELAYRLQMATPEALDANQETAATHRLYGLDNPVSRPYGTQLLLARRLVERGVRFVQIYSGPQLDHLRWDAHADLNRNHRDRGAETDIPVAGLLTDLKQRGLFETTLVIWAGEFGRLPITQGANSTGRDHNRFGFALWLAGAGIRGGASYGATDELGLHAVEGRTDVHDLHATILHLLGIDHERLTYQHAGRDYRLTDVSGRVIHEILA
jgi:hypothetical protein